MAGFVQFDPYKWEPSQSVEVAKVAKAAKVQLSLATLAGLAALPSELADGLERLSHMPPPRLLNPNDWPVVVADAHRLASEGWVAKALTLGWSDLDLFGAVPDKLGDPQADGLAVWLGGRRICLLSANTCTVKVGSNRRAEFTRRDAPGRVLLWQLGQTQRPRTSPSPTTPAAVAL